MRGIKKRNRKGHDTLKKEQQREGEEGDQKGSKGWLTKGIYVTDFQQGKGETECAQRLRAQVIVRVGHKEGNVRVNGA